MGTRRKSRELALQMLFQADMGKQPAADVRRTFWAERDNVTGEVRGFAEDLFRVAIDKADQINQMIEKHAQHWRMETDGCRGPQRLAQRSGGISGLSANPKAIVINEALEIARKYSSPGVGDVHQWRAG